MKGSHEPFVHNGVSFPAAAEANGSSYAFGNAGLPHLFEWRFPLENSFSHERIETRRQEAARIDT